MNWPTNVGQFFYYAILRGQIQFRTFTFKNNTPTNNHTSQHISLHNS